MRITTAQLAEILGISALTLKDWRKSGMPYKNEGRIAYYNHLDVAEWLQNSGRTDYAGTLKKLKSTRQLKAKAPKKPSTGKKTPPAKKTPPPISNIPADLSEITTLSIDDQRRILSQLIKNAAELMITASEATVIIAAQKNYTSLMDLSRKFESDCVELDIKLGNVMLISDVKALFGKIGTSIKTNLRTLPTALAERLSAVCDIPPQQIVDTLKPKVDEALRELSEELLEHFIKNLKKRS